MIKFNEQEKIDSVNGALALRPQINEIVDEICERGYSNICWLGVGGTWASAMQATVHMKEMSAIETWAENAAEYLTTGNKRITKDTVVIISSVTGNTKEVVDAIKKIKAEVGATVISFVDAKEAILLDLADYKISYPVNEQLKFFMIADRFMFNNGEFEDYEDMYAEFDKYLAQALVEVEKKAEPFAVEFAKKHWNDEMHYFVGAGNQWGATYSYAMCYAQRPLSERVANFIPRICENYTIIDSKDYELKGISEKYRKHLSHHVMHAVNNRIDVHMEIETRHPMEIRRYYRRLEY